MSNSASMRLPATRRQSSGLASLPFSQPSQLPRFGFAKKRPELAARAISEVDNHVLFDPYSKGHIVFIEKMHPLRSNKLAIRQQSAIVSRCQHLGLELSHLARGRGLGLNGAPSNDLAHHRIERQTVRVIHVIISGQPSKNRLPQKPDQRMQAVVTGPCVSQQAACDIVQTKHLV